MTLSGTIRGKTIELQADPGFPEGVRVDVDVRPASALALPADFAADPQAYGFGSWNDDPDGLDAFIHWNREQRRLNIQRDEP